MNLASLILPVGNLVQRHLDGVRLLVNKGVRVNRIWVLFGGRDEYLSDPFSVRVNALRLVAELRFWKPKIVHWDPTSEENVASQFTRIIRETQQEFGEKEEVYVDISSTTKTAIVVSTLFAMLFGLKVYHVRATASYPLTDRTSRLYRRMLEDKTVVKQLHDAIRHTDGSNLEEVMAILQTGQSKAHHSLTTESRGTAIVECSRLGRTIVSFTDNDKKTIVNLSKREFGTLHALAEFMGKRDSAVAYVIEKLEDWGLVDGLKLSPVGLGIAHGLTDPNIPSIRLADGATHELKQTLKEQSSPIMHS